MTTKSRPVARVTKSFSKPSRTKQAHKSECDINNILKKYHISQLAQHANHIDGDYGDFTGIDDYQSSLDAVLQAEQNFQGLPAKTRRHFNNDPAQLLNFINNPQNIHEAAALGLLSDEVTKQLKKQQKENSNEPPKTNDEPNDEQNK